ncbi:MULTISPECIES: response regulator [Nostoc]|uniref:histidine kinase n=1 Tax=Nostoc paludosum FACHB-159 TaxID=2692908 RepID=A0ABR8K8E1_9NOSO|nr:MULTISPECIES: response regulator [Nostoc]MBD2679478.1 response regulator [Nostoc sp. FACHB-857]MBD2735737.1 response regulator [Nostoc paludosum FACHB-159]
MLRILLIDDNPNDRLLAIRQLEREFSDLEVEQVVTAQDLAQALERGQFNLVVTDYQLRWSNGIEVLHAIKASYPNCPVIMFTNSGTQEIAVEAMKSGLDDYVIKSPQHQVRLTAAVRSALERAETRQKAANLEIRFQTLLNRLNVGIYRATFDGSLLECNPAFLRLIGLGTLPQEQASRFIELYFQLEDYTQLINQLRENGEVRDREIQLRRADGSLIWVRVSKTFSKIDGKGIIDGLVEDISDRKQVELEREQLLISEQAARMEAEAEKQNYSLLSEASRLLVSSLDYRTTLAKLANLVVPTLADCCLIDIVETNLTVFEEPVVAASTPEKEALALLLRRFYSTSADADFGVRKVLQTGEPELVTDATANSFLLTMNQDAETQRLMRQMDIQSYIIVPLLARDAYGGMRLRKLGTITLITTQRKRRYSTANLNMAQALALRAATAIDNARLYQQAIDANRIKDEFLAVLSHEIRTPLNPILGWAKLLRTNKLDREKTALALETIERNAKLQTKLIEDLLDISRILRGKLSLNVCPVDLATIIRAAMETVRLSAEAKSIQIHSALDPAVGQVFGDAGRLQQIVWNLLSNAIKFTPEGGQVEIYLEQIDSQVQIRVKDTGKGINRDFLPYVFETFRQADSATTRKFGGLGLGLAIVRYLVEMHGGTVLAESLGEGHGATFIVKLPMILTDTVDSSKESDVMATNTPAFNGLKILVVDDEPDSLELVSFVLQQSGATVTAVSSATEVLEILPQWKPDLLVSDIGMPGMDGYMLLRQIRLMSPEQGGQILAIALTAYAGEGNEQRAKAVGFQAHISKPIDPAQLIETIANLVPE